VYEFELAYIREIEPQQEERWKAAISGLLRQWTTNLGRMWFVESEGRSIGYCFWEPGKEAAVLSSIYVQPAERRHGWGR
jgi:[ribosomal protein S18]-alanine N-acetyltransferase